MSIKPHAWYRLTNGYTGPTLALDVINDGTHNDPAKGLLNMATVGNFTGQHWNFVERSEGKYEVSTWFLGTNRALNVYGNNMTTPHLALARNFSGQRWNLTLIRGTTYKLSNDYSGPDLHLDVKSDTRIPYLSTGDHTGQYWDFTEIRDMITTDTPPSKPSIPDTELVVPSALEPSASRTVNFAPTTHIHLTIHPTPFTAGSSNRSHTVIDINLNINTSTGMVTTGSSAATPTSSSRTHTESDTSDQDLATAPRSWDMIEVTEALHGTGLDGSKGVGISSK